MLFTVAICDDNEEDIQIVLSYLKKYESSRSSSFSFAPNTFSKPEELLSGSSQSYDLYFLDILMSGMTGIDLARRLREQRPATLGKASIIFLTASPDYALPAFSVYASGYLVKPVSFRSFSELLDIVTKDLSTRKSAAQRCFSFRVANGICNTPVSDILYVEIMGHTPYFHLTNGTVKGSELRISFAKSIQPLLDCGLFLFPHRSYVVNAAHVASFSVQELILDNKDRIPVSRNRFSQTKAQYMDFLMEDSRHV